MKIWTSLLDEAMLNDEQIKTLSLELIAYYESQGQTVLVHSIQEFLKKNLADDVLQKNPEYFSSMKGSNFFQKQMKEYLQMALDPWVIFSFTLSAWSYQWTKLRYLKTLSHQRPQNLFLGFMWNRGPIALNRARLLALGMETSVFTSMGMGPSFLEGRKISPEELGRSWIKNGITLSVLKTFYFSGFTVFEKWAAPSLLPTSSLSQKMTGHLSAVLGLSLAHELQFQVGLRSDHLGLKETLIQSAIVQSHMSLGAYLVKVVSLRNYEKEHDIWRRDLFPIKDFDLKNFSLAMPIGQSLDPSKELQSETSSPATLWMSVDDPSRSGGIRANLTPQDSQLKHLLGSLPFLKEVRVLFDFEYLKKHGSKNPLLLLDPAKLLGYQVLAGNRQGARELIPEQEDFPAIREGDYLVPPELFLQRQGQEIYRHAKYRVEGLLGEGGNGLVLRVRDQKFQRDLAAKFIPRRYGDLGESEPHEIPPPIQKEAKLSTFARTISIHEAFRLGAYDVIIMELLEGVHLNNENLRRKLLEEDRDLSVRVAIGKQLTTQLADLARRGLLHRDIKGNNIMFNDPNGDLNPKGITVRIYDMGTAVRLRHPERKDSLKLGNGNTLTGTPTHAHPHYVSWQKNFENWENVDLYSMGVLLFELVTGYYPYNLLDRSNPDSPKVIDVRPIIYYTGRDAQVAKLRRKLITLAYGNFRKKTDEDFSSLGDILGAKQREYGVVGVIYNYLRYRVSAVPRFKDLVDLPDGAQRGVYLELERIIRKCMGLDGQAYESAEDAYRDLDRLSKDIGQLPQRDLAFRTLSQLQKQAQQKVSILNPEERAAAYLDFKGLSLVELYQKSELLKSAVAKFASYDKNFQEGQRSLDEALQYRRIYRDRHQSSVRVWDEDSITGKSDWVEANEAWSHYIASLVLAEKVLREALRDFPQSRETQTRLLRVIYLRYIDTYDTLLAGERREIEESIKLYDFSHEYTPIIKGKLRTQFRIHHTSLQGLNVKIFKYEEDNVGRNKNYSLSETPVFETRKGNFDLELERGYYLIEVNAAGHFPLVHRFEIEFKEIKSFSRRGEHKLIKYDLPSYKLFPEALRDWVKSYFVYVPPMRAGMGIDPRQEMGPLDLSDLRSRPAMAVKTQAAFVAKVPVSVGEYAAYIASLIQEGKRDEAFERLPRYDDNERQWLLEFDDLSERLPGSPAQVFIPRIDKYKDPQYLNMGIHGISFEDALAYMKWRGEKEGLKYQCVDLAVANGVSGGDLSWHHVLGQGVDRKFQPLSLEYFEKVYGDGRKNHVLPFDQIKNEFGHNTPYGIRFLLDYLREYTSGRFAPQDSAGQVKKYTHLLGGPSRSPRGASQSRHYLNLVRINQRAEQVGSFRLQIWLQDLIDR